MSDITAALHLDAILTHRTARTAAIRDVLQPGGTRPPSIEHAVLAYALAHHQLEGAEAAAHRRDSSALAWYRADASHDLMRLTLDTGLGPRIVVAPPGDQMIRTPLAETPYYVLGRDTAPAAAHLAALASSAFAHTDEAGLGGLTASHAAVVCLTGHRSPDQIVRNFTITRLPATIFTDHIGDPLVLGRDLVHEAAHNWLNDALAALQITIPEAVFFSPWRNTERPAFGFLHACFAFPLTAIYTAHALPAASGPARTVLADHLRQQRSHLARTDDDFAQVLKLIDHEDLRQRLEAVYHYARTL
ncbi:aKG-HExxH-type peptide beta-hydroxylase [Streptomyces lunaelactis]|uniref:aKG-HExxH-type peptide beta-hydroxylase n=1 Tax=Streptomyces lunaelactis TaxID=1535768 RepID=UPI0020C8031A|nr:HEXXH motif-containing putative peptide modification protein [Streptomyces lunaelactis]